MQQATQLDINADLGEGGAYDELIMPLISSCNIACGGHTGDEISIRKTLRLAKQHQVKVGAHPAFPDKQNFGRKMLEIDPEELQLALKQQLELFKNICADEGIEIHHIKAHGALYNQGSNREDYVDSILTAFRTISPTPFLFTQANNLLFQKAKSAFPIKLEAFIDRRYEHPDTLRSREAEDALISDPEQAWEHLERMLLKEELKLANGSAHPFEAETYCIHGDHQASLDILRYIHQQLNERGIRVK